MLRDLDGCSGEGGVLFGVGDTHTESLLSHLSLL
jgi:hypothetical protein